MDSKFIFCVLICSIANVECLINNISRQDFPLIKDGEPCMKGRMYRMACNTCHCADNNALYCTKMACLEDTDMLRLKLFHQQSVKTQRSDRQDELKKGNSKNPGSENKTDKLKKDILITPKQGNEQKTLKKDNLKNLVSENKTDKLKKGSLRPSKPGNQEKTLIKGNLKNVVSDNRGKKIKKDILRTGNEKKIRKHNLRSQVSEDPVEILKKEDEEKYLPTLHNGPCIPGKLFRRGCAKCYCNDGGVLTCGDVSRTGCNDFPKPSDVQSPNDVMPSIPNDVYWKLPILPHSAAVCKPGKMYMVACNACLCLNNGNLLCEQLLCIDQEEMNYSKAKKWSGASCNKGDAGLSTRCVRCQCVSSLTSCHPVPGCVEPNVMKLHGDTKARMSLDSKKEKCEPGTVYRVDCNYCYCQPNRMLRCTRKSCLNYRQALMLKKQRSYLEKHGL